MSTEWLLVGMYGGIETASVVAVGLHPKPFIPLEQHFASRRSGVNTRSVDAVRTSLIALSGDSAESEFSAADRGRRTIARAVRHDDGTLHAAYVWRGPEDETPDPARSVGAWEFNLTAGTAHGSADLFELYGVPEEKRRQGVAQAGAFDRLRTNADEGAALAKMIRAAPGTQHQAVWTVVRDDGAERAAHFSCRMLTSSTGDVVMRGTTQDLGAAHHVQASPPPQILEHRVLEAIRRPGEYRAIVDLRRLRLIRWHGEPMPGVAWEALPGQPTPRIHDDDLSIATAMSSQLATTSPVSGVLRFQGLDDGWISLHLEVALMALDQSTTAGLAVVREVPRHQE